MPYCDMIVFAIMGLGFMRFCWEMFGVGFEEKLLSYTTSCWGIIFLERGGVMPVLLRLFEGS